MITVCLTYFKSLGLANLDAALYAVGRQDFTGVKSLVIVDNDTADSTQDIERIIRMHVFPVPVRFLSVKHGDQSRTHSWSTNVAVREAQTPWVLFTRADYLLDFDFVKKCLDVIAAKEYDIHGIWNGFVTGNVYHLNVDIGQCERARWRSRGPHALRSFVGAESDYTLIDAGVWMARREAFERVGGLDERLTAWGHAQTHFQHKLYKAGVEFVRIPEGLFYHPLHAAPRDIVVAHQQLQDSGADLKDMWKRYEGASPY